MLIKSRKITVKFKIIAEQSGITENIECNGVGYYKIYNNKILHFHSEDNFDQFKDVTFEIYNKQKITLTYKFPNPNKLYFDLEHDKSFCYKTDYGDLKLILKTNKLDINLDDHFAKGRILVNYQMFEQNNLLGNYKILLQFQGSV